MTVIASCFGKAGRHRILCLSVCDLARWSDGREFMKRADFGFGFEESVGINPSGGFGECQVEETNQISTRSSHRTCSIHTEENHGSQFRTRLAASPFLRCGTSRILEPSMYDPTQRPHILEPEQPSRNFAYFERLEGQKSRGRPFWWNHNSSSSNAQVIPPPIYQSFAKTRK